MKFGTENIYKKNAPDHVKQVGLVGAIDQADWKYLDQKSNGVFTGQNHKAVGKTLLGYNSLENTWIIVSQQNGKEGFTLDQLRDQLLSQGYDNILGFDGSTSSTLIEDGKIKVSPNKRKNSTIPSGVNLSVPEN